MNIPPPPPGGDDEAIEQRPNSMPGDAAASSQAAAAPPSASVSSEAASSSVSLNRRRAFLPHLSPHPPVENGERIGRSRSFNNGSSNVPAPPPVDGIVVVVSKPTGACPAATPTFETPAVPLRGITGRAARAWESASAAPVQADPRRRRGNRRKGSAAGKAAPEKQEAQETKEVKVRRQFPIVSFPLAVVFTDSIVERVRGGTGRGGRGGGRQGKGPVQSHETQGPKWW